MGLTDVRAASAWAFDQGYGIYPFIPVKVTLEAREAGHRFKMHSRLGGVAGAPEAAIPCTAVADGGMAKLDLLVGTGLQFWITRDAEDGRANQPAAPFTAANATVRNTWVANTANQTYPASTYFPQNPVRAASLVPHRFQVNAQANKRAGHRFAVEMSDGYKTVFTNATHNDPVTGVSIPAYAAETISYSGPAPLSNPLPISTFTALVDPTLMT